VVPDFTGELKCVEVDDSGAPLSGNHLKGEAVIVLPSFGGDIATYNALAIEGSENNGDGTLVLGGGQCAGDGGAKGAVCTTDDDCADSAPCAAEYNACPQTWILNHLADEAPNIAIEEAGNGPSRVETELTVVPCTENFETQQPTSVTIQFITTNEFESQFSSSTTITCWGDFFFDDFATTAFLFGPGGAQPPDPQGTMYLQTRMRAAGATPYGMLMVALEHHIDEPGNEAHAAVNLHVEGARSVPDIITIPNDQLTP
jgi:hypothetical protein